MIAPSRPAPGLDGGRGADRGRIAGLGAGAALLILSYGSMGLGKPRLVSNLTLTDILLFGVIVTWALHALRDRSASSAEASRLVVPISLILTGSLIAAMHVGVRPFVIDDLLRDVAAFCSFLAALDLLRRSGERVRLWALRAAMVSVALVTITLLLDPTLRARGTFPNPNVPAHLLACSLVVFAVASRGRWRALIIAVVVVGLYRTGSFGSGLQLMASFGYLVIHGVVARTRNRERTRLAFFAAMLLVAVVAVLSVNSYLTRPQAKAESGLSSARLDRSSSTRFDVWADALSNFQEHPFGTGPGSSRALHLLTEATETHNEPLSYLSERGFIGFAGLVLLWVVVWRMTQRGGAARAILCGYLMASVFRETLHYRHWWLLLPLAMVVDEGRLASSGRRRAEGPVPARAPEVAVR